VTLSASAPVPGPQGVGMVEQPKQQEAVHWYVQGPNNAVVLRRVRARRGQTRRDSARCTPRAKRSTPATHVHARC
jgi:hypothetical protein